MVPVMDEAGLIVTKSYSFQNPKRNRDLFDIYLAVRQCRNRSDIISCLRTLKREEPATFNTLYAIDDAIARHPSLLASVNNYLPEEYRQSEASIRICLIEFLRDAGVVPTEGIDHPSQVIVE